MTAETRASWKAGLVAASWSIFSLRRVELRPVRWRRAAGMLSKVMLKTATTESAD
jgi:hypothetical protein